MPGSESKFIRGRMTEDARIYTRSIGGIIGTHAGNEGVTLPLAASSASEFNTIRRSICPFACWKVEDLRFAFDSSFLILELPNANTVPEVRGLRRREQAFRLKRVFVVEIFSALNQV